MRPLPRFAWLLAAALVVFPLQAAAQAARVEVVKCRGCHVADPPAWKESYHSKMVKPAAEGVLPEAVAAWQLDRNGTAGPRAGNIDGRSYSLDDVVLVVSSKWKQRYLVKLDGGRSHQFLDKQWDAYTGRWERYANRGDWETVCGACHSRPQGDAAALATPGRVADTRDVLGH
jgi:cytochrome c553